MEVRDGFIVGIFNYCDGWCERCALTSYCRLFADRMEMEASLDPNLKAVADAPPVPEELPPPPPAWMQELFEEINDACRNPPSRKEWQRMRPRVPAEHKPIDRRAKDYAMRTHHWLTATAAPSGDAKDEAREVIAWFHFLVVAKINRALTRSPDDDVDDAGDNDGSAKVALLGIDRSHGAWLDLVERAAVTAADAEPFIADLVWLGEALEGVRPRARAFVRPAFDEPDAVAQFLAQQRGR